MGGATLRQVMEDRGMTRYRLSKVSGIPWATLSDICTGRTELERCSAGTVLKLARALGLTVEETLDLETGEVTRGTDRSHMEADLPPDLAKAIDDLEKCDPETCGHFDCMLDEVYGSINTNYHGGRITEEQAEHLRAKYVFGDLDD